MIEHVSLRCKNVKKSKDFYERALAPLGYRLSKRFGDAFGFKQAGRHDFWVTKGKVGTPTHIAFHARTIAAVDAFYRAAPPPGARTTARPACARTTATPPSSTIPTATTSKP